MKRSPLIDTWPGEHMRCGGNARCRARSFCLGAIASIAALLLAACGGGGGGSVAAAGPSVGIDRSGNSVGTVTGFGSVFVNGIEFSTSGATITKDGQSATERDLRVGQVVTVVGSRDEARATGTATQVVFDDNVEGPVTVIDVTNNRVVVLGQTVLVDAGTVFDDAITPSGLDGLTLNDVLEVSGFTDAAGAIHATRIERKASGGTVEVTGTVSVVDTAAKQFSIGDQRVDYSSATLADFSAANPVNGQRVEVKGSVVVATGLLAATRVELKGTNLIGNSGQQSEIEGFISRFASAQDIDVSGQKITTSSSTVFEGGTASLLALGIKVEVQGRIADGALGATKVQIKLASTQRVQGRVQTIDRTARRLTVLGVVIETSNDTQFEDNGPARLSSFSLANINVDDYVEVRGVAGSNGVDIVAIRVERDDAEDQSELRGQVQTFSDPTLTINGVTVTIGDGTQLQNRSGEHLSRGAFFAALQVGDQLHVHGNSTGVAAVAALEVEYGD